MKRLDHLAELADPCNPVWIRRIAALRCAIVVRIVTPVETVLIFDRVNCVLRLFRIRTGNRLDNLGGLLLTRQLRYRAEIELEPADPLITMGLVPIAIGQS